MSTGSARSQPNRQILEEASAWFVDFRTGDIDAAACEAFQHWLQRSPEHIQAYLEIAVTYGELPSPAPDALDIEALVAHARSSRDENIIPLPMPAAAGADRSSPVEASGRSRRRGWFLAAAASVLFALVAMGTWHYLLRETYWTRTGEQRSLTLADGSTVELNSHSRIRVRYSERERRIDLLEGQALFQVASNKGRPFVVRTGDTLVRAVGTRFDVYRKRNETVVTVVEGRVAVGPGDAESGSLDIDVAAETAIGRDTQILLDAGQQVIVKARSIPTPTHVNVAAATAWTTRQLIFEGTPLAEVAEEFNRYSTRRLIVDERLLGQFHVSGTYSSTNSESLLRFLRAQPGIRLIETDREIRVTRE